MAEKIKQLEGELAKNKISIENHTKNTDENYCEECDYRYGKKSSVRKHITTKHGKVKCLECGKDFKSSNELKCTKKITMNRRITRQRNLMLTVLYARMIYNHYRCCVTISMIYMWRKRKGLNAMMITFRHGLTCSNKIIRD